MTKKLLFAGSSLLLLLFAGCGGTPDLQIIGPEAIDGLSAAPDAMLAAAPDGAIMLASDDTIFRIHPQKGSVETIFEGDSENDLTAVTVADDGLLYVGDRDRLKLFAGGRLHNLVKSNSSSGKWFLSAHGKTALYAAEWVSGRSTTLFRYELGSKDVFGIAVFEEPIQAIAAVRGGCLVAISNTIYKIFDHSDGDSKDALCLMVCSVASGDRQICGLAIDEDRRAVFFTTEDGTWAFVDGQIVPLLPAGGALAFAKKTLSIWDHDQRQLFQIGNPATRARTVLKAMR
jgi:hypothetical protein